MQERLKFHACSALALPFEDDSSGGVWSLHKSLHIDDKLALLPVGDDIRLKAWNLHRNLNEERLSLIETLATKPVSGSSPMQHGAAHDSTSH